jgi:hypothetical protein
VGDTKKDALTDCLKRIRTIPIEEVVPTEDLEGTEIEKQAVVNLKKPQRSLLPSEAPAICQRLQEKAVNDNQARDETPLRTDKGLL